MEGSWDALARSPGTRPPVDAGATSTARRRRLRRGSRARTHIRTSRPRTARPERVRKRGEYGIRIPERVARADAAALAFNCAILQQRADRDGIGRRSRKKRARGALAPQGARRALCDHGRRPTALASNHDCPIRDPEHEIEVVTREE